MFTYDVMDKMNAFFTDDGNVIRVKSPQLEHTTPFMYITNGDVQSLPLEDRTKASRLQQQSPSQRRMVQVHSAVGVDAVLAKKVTVVQAHVRGYLTRKHLEPLKMQTKAATVIQAYWYGLP